MALPDLNNEHLDPADKTAAEAGYTAIETAIQSYLRNLSTEENNKIGFINETNKLLVNKVRDYRNNQPALSTPDVDWVEFQADFDDRLFYENFALKLIAMGNAMLETKRLHDYDNYQAALLDYAYAQYKNGTSQGLGYDSKEDELKQFFAAGKSTPTVPPPPPSPPPMP